jgi:integrase
MEWNKDKLMPSLYRRERLSKSVWVIRARVKGGNAITVTLGNADLISAVEARQLAKKELAKLSQGINPNAERKQAKKVSKARGFTLAQAVEQYSEIAHWKPKTRQDALSTLQRRFGDWYRRPLADISREDCLNRFQEIKKDVSAKKARIDKKRGANSLRVAIPNNEVGLGEAQRAFRYLSAVFNSFSSDDAAGEKLLPKGNPVLVLKDKKVRRALKPKEVYLDSEQRENLYQELRICSHYEYKGNVQAEDADLAWLLMHTGLRLEEALQMKWANVDFKQKIFTAIDTKNHTNHTLPMTSATETLFKRRFSEKGNLKFGLKSPFVYPSPLSDKQPMTASRTFDRLSEAIGFKFTAHDLRRTVATVADGCGYDLDAIGKILNHKKKGVTARYIQNTHQRLKAILEDVQNNLFIEPEFLDDDR